MSKLLIAIAGPTAIGKTSFAIALAQMLDCPILSCDARQFYRELCIGTAVPSDDEQKAAQHFFIHHKSVQDDYSVGHFVQDATALLDNIFLEKEFAILVGGSGLYYQAVLQGIDEFPPISAAVKKQVAQHYQTNGLAGLQNELKMRDAAYYHMVDLQNPQRIMRALEVCLAAGKPYSTFRSGQHAKRNFDVLKIGLDAPREVIYERINSRVNQMMTSGLLDEVTQVYPLRHLNGLQTVGYKELFDYLDNKLTLDNAIEEIKKNTRRYAKRQLTWFKKDSEINWVNYLINLQELLLQFPQLKR